MQGSIRRLLPALAGLAVLASSALAFWLVARRSSFLDVDSGPYLSMAHHLATRGRPMSGFQFLGTFERLPGYPNFIPPGLGLAVGLFAPAAGLMGAAKVVLAASLLGAHLAAFLFLRRATGEVVFALAASVLLVWNLQLAGWAGLILTELPYVACLLAALAAAARVLAGREDLRSWTLLAAASAGLALLRYLGVSFPLALGAVYLGRALRRGEALPALARLTGDGAASLAPLGAWMLVVRAGGAPAFPGRPAARLGLTDALGDAGATLLAWLGPYLAVGAALWALSRFGRRQAPAPATLTLLPLAALAAYLALLIAVRTTSAFYPLDELGYRYLAPAWPPAFLAGALLFHGLVWVRRTRSVLLGTAAAALLALGWQARPLLGMALPEPYPFPTETFRRAAALVPPDATVLSNFGQALVPRLPEARIVGIPSRQDFRYTMDLPALVERHGVSWLVLFAHPEADEIYGGWFERWLRAPPAGVEVQGRWRLADGAIYRIAPSP